MNAPSLEDVEAARPRVYAHLRPTPLLRANFTVNTDFAQTEVDQRQVNLTRYSLFFPERRDFFLDGTTFFDFASDSGGGDHIYSPVGRNTEERIIPFFSRRIGLSTDAAPQKIDFGTKMTGQVRAQDVGLLQPMLVELRRQLDPVGQHAGAGDHRIGHVRKQPMQRMAEFVEQRAGVVVRIVPARAAADQDHLGNAVAVQLFHIVVPGQKQHLRGRDPRIAQEGQIAKTLRVVSTVEYMLN